jgi:DedD protein
MAWPAAAASAQHEPLGATEVAEASSEAARNPVAAKPPSPEKSESSGSAAKSASAVAPPAPSGGAASSSTSGEVKRAQAASDAKVVDKAPSERGGHFVVQVGAFADVSSAREVRQKLEKLGLKSYTEVTETTGGHRVRVRVGPYATREEADRALAKIRSSGAAAVLMTL